MSTPELVTNAFEKSLAELLAEGQTLLAQEEAYLQAKETRLQTRIKLVQAAVLTAAQRRTPEALHGFMTCAWELSSGNNAYIVLQIPESLPLSLYFITTEYFDPYEDDGICLPDHWKPYTNANHDPISVWYPKKERRLFDGDYLDLAKALALAKKYYEPEINQEEREPAPAPVKLSLYKKLLDRLETAEIQHEVGREDLAKTITVSVIAHALVDIARSLDGLDQELRGFHHAYVQVHFS